ncbi:MAG TPA: hypothetical protein VEZ90_16415 [Blastocatellia bacterium]|nr:hypothetical protein [Blastocatellia bacterium]
MNVSVEDRRLFMADETALEAFLRFPSHKGDIMSMRDVNEKAAVDSATEKDARHLRRALEIERLFNQAVRDAQEENRRLGISSYYEINGYRQRPSQLLTPVTGPL